MPKGIDQINPSVALSADESVALIDCDGFNSVGVQVSGTFSATLLIEATIDGTNYFTSPAYNPSTMAAVTSITGATQAVVLCAAFRLVRVRIDTYTSGTANVSLVGARSFPSLTLAGTSTVALATGSASIGTTVQRAADLVVTATGTAGAAVTMTLPAVASQFHYISLIEVTQYAGAILIAAATPITVTTTNIPGSPVFTLSAAALGLGAVENRVYPFSSPVKSSVVNTATTIVCPASTNVIWRVNCTYYTAT